MKELLERWSQLEPQLCRQDWTGDYQIELGEGHSTVVNADKKLEPHSLADIQWAIQQAIIEKGWQYTLSYDHGVGNEVHISYGAKGQYEYNYSSKELSLVEILLVVYLKVLDVNS